MVPIAGGSVEMGSSEKNVGQTPIHKVTISPFLLDRREVTVAEYARCVDAGKCVSQSTVDDPSMAPPDRLFFNALCNLKKGDKAEHPVNCIDHAQASAYCEFAGKRLPTEAEWEFAARGKEGRVYPWGNDAPTIKNANACDLDCKATMSKLRPWGKLIAEHDNFDTTAPVGSFPDGASADKVDDLTGNVWEWVSDWYSPAYYASSPEKDPPGPESGSKKVVRGGSWNDFDPKFLTASVRFGFAPKSRFANVGFRCAKTAK